MVSQCAALIASIQLKVDREELDQKTPRLLIGGEAFAKFVLNSKITFCEATANCQPMDSNFF